MLFGVDYDKESSLHLYLIPDTGSTVPSIVLRNDGVDILRLVSNETQPHLVKAGRHATGQCGFHIDSEVLPDLASYRHLEIVEPVSQTVIYRRMRPAFIPMKVFRLETHLLPLWRFDEAFTTHFQYWFKGVDRLGRETAQQTFNVINTSSTYTSGRLYMRNFEKFISRGLKVITIIRDPYEEMAERLIILKNVGERANDLLGERDSMLFEGVIAELAELSTFDLASCKRFFKALPTDVAATLSNPFVRQLTVGGPTERPPQTCLGIALQILAEFAVVGLRSNPQEFSSAVAELVGFEPSQLPVMKEFAKVVELGNILRQIRDIELILEQDLELFHHMREAFSSVPEA